MSAVGFILGARFTLPPDTAAVTRRAAKRIFAKHRARAQSPGRCRTGCPASRAQALATRVYFNDPRLIDQGLCESVSGHDNHFHIEIHPPQIALPKPAASQSLGALSASAFSMTPREYTNSTGYTPPSGTGSGISLVIGSAYRDAATQAKNAAKNSNRQAVGGARSAHVYGLAVDLHLSVDGLSITEISTKSVPNMVKMYRSPVYKWLFPHGAEFGWYPFRNEPWPWEYNPPGFPEQYAK